MFFKDLMQLVKDEGDDIHDEVANTRVIVGNNNRVKR